MKKKMPLLGVKIIGELEEEVTSWAWVSLAVEFGESVGRMKKR